MNNAAELRAHARALQKTADQLIELAEKADRADRPVPQEHLLTVYGQRIVTTRKCTCHIGTNHSEPEGGWPA